MVKLEGEEEPVAAAPTMMSKEARSLFLSGDPDLGLKAWKVSSLTPGTTKRPSRCRFFGASDEMKGCCLFVPVRITSYCILAQTAILREFIGHSSLVNSSNPQFFDWVTSMPATPLSVVQRRNYTNDNASIQGDCVIVNVSASSSWQGSDRTSGRNAAGHRAPTLPIFENWYSCCDPCYVKGSCIRWRE